MKKLFLLMVAAVLGTGWAAAQNTAEQSEEEMVFLVVDEMPAFPGGQEALFKYLTDNVIYPQIAKENGIEGRVICTFVIEPDGRITNVEVVRSGGDPSLDKEAVRVVKAMPKWRPGKQRGQAVRVKFTIPVKFSLAKEAQKDK